MVFMESHHLVGYGSTGSLWLRLSSLSEMLILGAVLALPLPLFRAFLFRLFFLSTIHVTVLNKSALVIIPIIFPFRDTRAAE